MRADDADINLMCEYMHLDMTRAVDIFVQLKMSGIDTTEVWKNFYGECGSELGVDKLSAMAAVFDEDSPEYASVTMRLSRFAAAAAKK